MSKLHVIFRLIYFIVLPISVFFVLGYIFAFPYDAGVNYSVSGLNGENPNAVYTADFDNDGDNDLAVQNNTTSNLMVMLNDGSGGYGDPVSYPIGSSPFDMTFADFNADGNIDFAGTSRSPDYDVSILFGNGDGTFGGKTDYSITSPLGIDSADLDGDGDIDLAVANSLSFGGNVKAVTVLLNNGAGVFAVPVNYAIGGFPYAVTAGDFDGDGDNDLVATANETARIYILLNNGNGTFAVGANYATDVSPVAVVSADLDGDGDQDLATANSKRSTDPNSTVSVFKGNGNGTFVAAVNYVTDLNSYSIQAADLDADGDCDLITANTQANNVNILRNNGNATFAAKVSYTSGYGAGYVSANDLDNDGDVDLVATNAYAQSYSVIFGNGDATFASPVEYHFGKEPYFITGADFDNDNDTDLVLANADGVNFWHFTNNGDFTFGGQTSYEAGSSVFSLFPADLNGDGSKDIVTANNRSDSISVLLGNGDGTFGAKTDYAAGAGPASVVTADFDNDGDNDIASANTSSRNISVFLNNGTGIFGPKTDFLVSMPGFTSPAPRGITVADFDGDGNMDLVTSNSSNLNTISVFFGNGDGTFDADVQYTTALGPDSVCAADFDGDGDTDLAASNTNAKSVSVFLNDGAGSFAPKVDYAVSDNPRYIISGDFDADGDQDLALSLYNSSLSSDKAGILLNNGNGTFAAEIDYVVGDNPFSIFAADLDGDSDLDLATSNSKSDDFTVLRSLRLNVSVTQSDSSTRILEQGHSDTISVVLTSLPLGNVVFDISSTDATSASVSPSQLTFTAANWNTPQTITVSPQLDEDSDSETPNVVIAVNDALSEDHWDAVADRLVAVSVEDNNPRRAKTEFIVPLEGLKFSINNGAKQTVDPNVNLSMFGGDDAKLMTFNSTDDLLETKQEDFSPTKAWNLCRPKTTCPYGTYKVYTRFYNNYGSYSETLSASIEYAEKISGVGAPAQEVVIEEEKKLPELFEKIPPEKLIVPVVTEKTESKWKFTRSLFFGRWGNDVKLLQQFLNAHGYVLSKTGAGSPGKETRFFGFRTRAALKRFQAANKLPAYGFFGPLTRAFILKNF